MRTGLLAMLVASVLAGCGQTLPQASLFPLEPGRRWVYDVKTEWENNTLEHEPRIITTEGEDKLPGGGTAWRRRSADGVDWWLRVDDGGVYRVATKSDLDEEPRADAQRRYVLKAPIAVGTAWQATTTAYLLRRRQEFPPEIRHSHPAVVMTYTIEALDDKVSVQAGAFERCVRVAGSAVLKLFADPVVGWRDLPLTTTEWYCHGPGLVKVVRQEPAHSPFLVGGTQTLELTSWQ